MRPQIKHRLERFDAVCIAGVLLVALLGYMSLCRAKFCQLRHFSSLTREVSVQIEEMGSMRAALERERGRLEKVKEGLALLHQRVPDDLDTDGFLRELNEIANKKNVLIVKVRPGEVIERGSVIETPVAVEATARFADFYSFVAALQEMSRLATIEEIDLRAEEDRSCRISMMLRIYAVGENGNG